LGRLKCTQADPLSHLSTHLVTDTDDNKAQQVLRLKYFKQLAATSSTNSDTLEDDIKNATEQDPEVLFALQLLKQRGPSQLTSNLLDWEEHDGLVFYKGQIYIPKVPNLRKWIIRLCHDSLSTGHPG
jgi:hypothetical protein